MNNNIEGLWFLGYNEKSDYTNAKIAIIPIAYEGTVSYKKGTKNAPQAIIEASYHLESYDEEFNIDTNDLGLFTNEIMFEDNDPEELILKVESLVESTDKFPVILGGEHSITLGAIKALKKKHESFTIIQIDAHTDLEDSLNGSKYSHASVMRRAWEIEGISIVQIGIRSISKELTGFLKTAEYMKKPIQTIYAHRMKNMSGYNLAELIIPNMKQKVYITIDVDGFDPSVFPNTGTPEPNGIEWQEYFNLMKTLLRNKTVIGFDVVEHANYGKEHYSDFTAAKLVNKMIALIFKNANKK